MSEDYNEDGTADLTFVPTHEMVAELKARFPAVAVVTADLFRSEEAARVNVWHHGEREAVKALLEEGIKTVVSRRLLDDPLNGDADHAG